MIMAEMFLKKDRVVVATCNVFDESLLENPTVFFILFYFFNIILVRCMIYGY